MDLTTVFVTISAVLVFAAMPPYIIDVIKGKTRPERMTWFILSLLGVIAFISQIEAGASWSLVFSGLDTLGSLTVLGLSFWHGVGGATKLDFLALGVAGVGVAVSLIAKEPLAALIGVIVADFSGMILTILKVWKDPKSETTISWLLFATAGVFGLLTISEWTLGVALYPLYLVLANYSVPVIQLVRAKSYKS